MSNSPLPAPAQALFHSLETASSFSREALVQVGMPLLQHLLDGQSVFLETLEKATTRTQKELDRLLNRLEAERDEKGNVVGLGLSLRPTSHQYVTGGDIFYGWCAPDTLVYPPLLQHTAHVTSRDPISGAAVKLTVSPDTLEGVDPSSAVITWVEEGTPSSIRESFCHPGRFFADASTAQQWAAGREHTVARSIEEAYEDAHTIAKHVHKWRHTD